MTLVVPDRRFAELLADVERAIERDGFVVLQYADSEPVPTGATGGFQQAGGSGHCLHGDRHLVGPARSGRSREAVPSSPRIPPSPPVRAPYLRAERHYRRRGAWLEWRRPSEWRRWLAAAAWIFLAAHLAVWVLR